MKVSVAKLQSLLEAGAVHFIYTKKDGSSRPAIGTLEPVIVSALVDGGVKLALANVLVAGIRAFSDDIDSLSPERAKATLIEWKAQVGSAPVKQSRALSPAVFTYYDLVDKQFKSFSRDMNPEVYIVFPAVEKTEDATV